MHFVVVIRSIATLGFREQAIHEVAQEKSLKEQVLALQPFMRAHADRFSKEDLAEYSAHLQRFGGAPLEASAL